MAERSLRRAADRLAITQPAVSNALRRSKESIGEDLLTRSPSGATPTPRAEALWPKVLTALGARRLARGVGAGRVQPASRRTATC